MTDAEVSPNAYALKVKDTPMRPLFPENTVLIVDSALKPTDRDYAIVHIDKQKQTMLQSLKHDIMFDPVSVVTNPPRSQA